MTRFSFTLLLALLPSLAAAQDLTGVYAGVGDLRRYGWTPIASDQSAMFQRAMAAQPNGGEILVPGFNGCTVVNNITVSAAYTIRGLGGPNGQAAICPVTLNTTAFTVSSPFVTFQNLAFRPLANGVKQSGGAFIQVQTGSHRFRARDLTFSDFNEGIILNGNLSTAEITGLRAFLYVTGSTTSVACVHVLGGVDVRISQIICNGPGSTGQVDTISGVLVDNVGNLLLSDFNLVGMGANLLVRPADGQTVTALEVSNGFLTSGFRGAELSPTGAGTIARSRFLGVWFSGNTAQGLLVNGGNGVDVDSPHVFGNGTDGIAMLGGSNVRVRGGQVAGNGGNGVLSQISDWSVEGVTIGPSGGYGGNVSYGLYTPNTAIDRYRFVGNVVSGNTAGAIQDQGTGTNKLVVDNLGGSNSQGIVQKGVADSGGTGWRLLRVPN